MSWIPQFIKNLFTGAARLDAEAKALDPAQIQITRDHLNEFAHDPSDGAERFIHADLFLNALQEYAALSSVHHILGTTPQGVKAGAREALLNAVATGKCSFFHEQEDDKPIYVADMYVPVKYFAAHALRNLEMFRSTARPDIYAKALGALQYNMTTRSTLAHPDRAMTYVDEKNMAGRFEIGAAGEPLQTVLRPRKQPRTQPS